MYMLGELEDERVVVSENFVLAQRTLSFSNATLSLNKIMHNFEGHHRVCAHVFASFLFQMVFKG